MCPVLNIYINFLFIKDLCSKITVCVYVFVGLILCARSSNPMMVHHRYRNSNGESNNGNNYYFASPCPDTFQFNRDQSNGEIYGTIGVYSFDDSVVRLQVEMSVANRVHNYNGHIELAVPKETVLEDIRGRRPIRYVVRFPHWERIPPKITKILVNEQLVCSGPPQIMGTWVSIITTITLQHTLTMQLTSLHASPVASANPVSDDNGGLVFDGDVLTKIVPSLFPSPEDVAGGKSVKNPFLAISSTTTDRDLPPVDLTKNPFFNGDLLVPSNQVSRTPPKTIITTTPSPPTTTTTTTQQPPPKSPVTQQEFPVLKYSSAAPFSHLCGLTVTPNQLVVHGNVVPRGAFPWLAAMFSITNSGLEYKCSGSLISDRHIITAAHCVDGGPRNPIVPSKLLLVLGKLNIQRWGLSDGEKMIEAEKITIHPDYVPMTSDADIAVILLSEVVVFSKYIRPICLWSEQSDTLHQVVGQKGKVVGWGKDEHGNLMTAEPKQITVPIVSQEDCLWSSETFKFITSNRTFCAGDRSGAGPCNGDSGSGFIMMRNGRWVLRGVVSMAAYDSDTHSCDLKNYVVFTDTSKFRTWISDFLIY